MDLIQLILDLCRDRLSYTSDPKVKVRNAVWNIDEKFPNEIIKTNESGRNALFLPTGKAAALRNTGARNPRLISQESSDFVNAKSLIQSAWFIINDLESTIESLDLFIEHLNTIEPKHLACLSMDDVRTIFAVQETINAVKRCRELVTNREDIIYWTEDDETRYEHSDDDSI